ncbi:MULTISPECIES: trimethylamine methyltransferase family protein [Desulfococcus]|jgi:trimethylamine--corrinoid protein Co-methyltransferase|uniref:Methyltransferase n=1 Tax=Desulfococcus multivorans DSM 2059 TaxID=1121405 RepID=S7TM49_DESML|nr:trimethylamine methyltransferase family protein [Desulfococcus multivorans]AOY58299.1 MttB1: trimethylamine corrinoid protein 2 [Desulfococcus multivorans]AQV00637.1 trimethylamine methyltransferase [Desulfococcus multivorans]EPR37760.1 trimethylamine methyltransferase [Desulfococcus multivorans DSM 2059]MDX9817476.1 trimethylamine methyltransferase family protein [Desulfococcus multivorans]SJZ98361.1 trimethylamine---corrinoid protein Co-methyltransferase [Desulfococcus multivorans DSM 205
MYDRMQTLTQDQMTRIHDAAMDILGTTGIAFNEDEALSIFKANGFKVDGKIVFITEAQVRNALKTTPSRFTITARNPEKNVAVGEDDFVFVPGYGAPFVTLTNGEQREATMEDYDNFCKLIQTSKHIDMNGFMMVEPSDVPADTAHLDMIFSNIILCDKPFMGSPVSKQGAKDCVDMAAIIWGGIEKLKAVGPVTVSLINSLSPLQFSDEMAGSLIELARANQACVIASLIMAGSSGPVTLSGVLALQTAEILAGVTLAQLVNPGAPVIYGSTSSAMDMKTGGLSIGCPELSVVVSATAQMARFYNLPSRSGGGLTDAHFPDAQAGVESTLALTTAARNGINFILHANGILGSYISMSYEKFLIDEELCGITRRLLKPMEVTSSSIDVEMIKAVGIGGQYLTQPKTFQLCRTEFYLTDFMNRQNHAGWKAAGKKRIDEFAVDRLGQRLAAYEKPDIDPAIEAALTEFVTRRKKG